MIFNSLTFLVFFAVVMALHYAPFFSWHQKKINLLIASYLFYAAWNPPFVALGANHPLCSPPVDDGRNPKQRDERRITAWGRWFGGRKTGEASSLDP
jgi:hypothetical protein